MSYINSRTINHEVIYSYTVLYGFNQQLTNPKSPTWRTFEFGPPCVLLKGLKCAHILVQFIYDKVIYKL